MFITNLPRLQWQIPVLVLLVAALMPEITWFSNAFGLWPAWLLSMPSMAMVRYLYLERNKEPKRHFVNQSQVLVFQQKPANTKLRRKGFSKAA